MAIEDFFPFKPGQVVTADQWNELFMAIRNGTFFLNDQDPLVEQISNLASRVSVLEQEVNYLKIENKKRYYRENFVLSDLQNIVILTKTPVLDSEIVIFDSTIRIKRINQDDPVWDYYILGKEIHFNPTFSTQIENGDVLSVLYLTEE